MKVYGYKLRIVLTKKCLEIHPNFPVQETAVKNKWIDEFDFKAFSYDDSDVYIYVFDDGVYYAYSQKEENRPRD